MPILKNARHEKFAQGLFSGMSAKDAYIQAGYSEEGAKQNAHALITNHDLCARIAELFTASADEAILSKQDAARILTEIITSKVSDFVTMGADGGYIDIGPETAHAHAIQSVKSRTEYDDHGSDKAVIVEFKLLDKIRAIHELCEMMGYHAPTKTDNRHELSITERKEYELTEVLEHRISRLVERLLAGPAEDGSADAGNSAGESLPATSADAEAGTVPEPDVP